MARILITSALPYINGIKHLGNLVGSQLPADLYARYMRGRGHEVMFICATDEHGTPAELAAAKTGQPVADYCAEMHHTQAELARGFRLSFDHYGRSSSPQNHALTQHLAARLGEAGLIEEVSEEQVYSHTDARFLPDRYIEGTCPNCGYERARGDQCENCTKQLDPTDLIDPRSAISGGNPIWKLRRRKTPVSCWQFHVLPRPPAGISGYRQSVRVGLVLDHNHRQEMSLHWDGQRLAGPRHLPAIWIGACRAIRSGAPWQGYGRQVFSWVWFRRGLS